MVPQAPTNYRRREPLAAILLLIVILGLIFAAIIAALRMGFQGFQNTAAGADLIRLNDQAVQFLNRSDYVDAFPKLNYVIEHTAPGTPLYATAMHNMGTYYMEAAQDARVKGYLEDSREDFQRAYPLLPERQNEIRESLQSFPASTQSALPPLASSGSVPPLSPASPSQATGTSAATAPSAAGAAAVTPTAASAAAAAPDAPGAPAVDERTTYNEAYRSYQNGLRAENGGHTAQARSDYTDAVNRASDLSYTPPWVTDAKSRLRTLGSSGSAPLSALNLPSIGAGI